LIKAVEPRTLDKAFISFCASYGPAHPAQLSMSRCALSLLGLYGL